MAKISRTKGHNFERWFARWLKEKFVHLKVNAKRGWQSRHGGKEEADVETFIGEEPIPIHWELRHGKTTMAEAKYAQAVEDAKKGEVPIAVVKKNRGQPMVFMSLNDFAPFLEAWLICKSKVDSEHGNQEDESQAEEASA